MTQHLKKAELHCHIEGAAAPQLVLAQARKYNEPTESFIRDGSYIWNDFTTFLHAYDSASKLFRTEEDFALLAETYLTELAEAGTIFSELFVSPDHGEASGLGAEAYIRGLGAGMERARQRFGIESRMTVIGVRHLGAERVIAAAEFAARRPHPLISGFNMAGDERMFHVRDFVPAFDIARDAGLGITIHAGELCGAYSVRDALDYVKPSRIGHGVRAVEDMALVERIRDEGVVLEVCPGSNIALSVFPSFKAHPLRLFVDMGLKVTLNSDDPPFFHSSLAREYEIASTEMGFSDQEINQMTRTAIEAAFVDEETRNRLLQRL
ncbi:adenosine deaminase [Rhizobium alvei]|uniref:Adenine deaminase n=1 Tax=Rhizobium alvei TaxID=1132659 RepID=A0ABT8YS74_9HYPH|nr:adenosine deaminase [Rhizobium alvei]MDO6966202.1 adenosine deaminase [Rhizobium alvei]